MKKGLLASMGGYATILVTTLQTIIITRILGPVDVGNYAVFRQFSLLGAQLLTMGIPSSLIYFVSVEKKGIKELLSTNIAIHFVLSFLYLSILIAFNGTVGNILKNSIAISITIPFAYSLFIGFRNYFYNALIADLQVKRTAIIDFLPVTISFCVMGILIVAKELTLTTVLFFDLIVTPLIGSLIGFWFIARNNIRLQLSSVRYDLFFKQSRHGFWMNLSDFALLLQFYLVYQVVAAYTNDEEAIGYYSRAFSIINIFVTSLMFVVRYFYASWARADVETKKNGLVTALTISLFISTIVSVFICLFSTEIVVVLFGTKFLVSASYLKVLIFAIPFNIANLILASFNNSEGRVKMNFILMAISVGIFYLLSTLPVGERSLISVAYFYLIATVVLTIMMLSFVTVKYKLKGAHYFGQIKMMKSYFRSYK